MASLRRFRRRSCECKKRHATETAAAIEARRLRRKGSFVRWYSCRFCGGWHVGRPDNQQRQSIAANLRRQ